MEEKYFEIYKDAEVPKDWTPVLKAHCDKINIDFMSHHTI